MEFVCTLQEVESQIQIFMLAGYETSSTTLAYCSYLLSTHQDVQQRVQKEVDAFYESELKSTSETDDAELTYDRLIASNKLPYMDMVINETLRMYPIASKYVS
jgi:cytochrome P450